MLEGHGDGLPLARLTLKVDVRKSPTKLALALTLLLGFVFGGFLSSRLTGRSDAEAIQAALLANSALKITETLVLLRALHDGNCDGATERLESQLDFAIIELAGDYTASRDYYGGAAESLDQAREYRAVYPHNTLPSIDQRLHMALETKTKSR